MAAEHLIVQVKEENEKYVLSLQSVSIENIPEIINGESGHHVVYVRMLSELIARQLVACGKYSLTEDQIQDIALGSSLHDIGKLQIPQAILNKADTLTPVEYDIVKKHSILGEKIILEADSAIDIPGFQETACQIVRHHHERYDGTGYPDGLAGEEIPIAAQIVSIADTYDALTSDRSYKQALSQDVALEMISNGMCGIFNPTLVDALLHVVGDRNLVTIRSNLLNSRVVYADPYSMAPKKVMLLGNIQYITQDFLDATFPDAHIALVGPSSVKKSKKIKVYDQKQPNYKKILGTTDYDLIVYLAEELTYDTVAPSDAEDLRQFLKATKDLAKETKCLYLSSLDAAFKDRNDRGILATAKEGLCFHYAEKNGIDIKVIRVPYLYNAGSRKDYLFELMDQMHTGSRIRLREHADSKIYFLSMLDLSELILRIADGWSYGTGILTLNDEFGLSFQDLCDELRKLEPHTQFTFTGKNPSKQLDGSNAAIKKQYSWFPKYSILAELEIEYEKYLTLVEPQRLSLWERVKQKLGGYFYLVRVLELVTIFLLSELLVKITDSALFFSIVDFRLVFIVLMGTMHGMTMGLSAAALSSIAWIFAKLQSGTKWMTLFYEPTNWLAFVFFFLVGAVCGYIKLKKEDKIQFMEEEKHLLEEKLEFLRNIYEDTVREKRDLKKQIIGSKDSFGKIFDITRQLNSVDSRDLYLKIINNFEDVLENKSISVYSVNEGAYFARLEVASRDIMGNVSRSISLKTYAPVMDKIQEGEVWRNTNLLPGMPMFACGIMQHDKPLLLIFLWSARLDQHSLYYVNLFRILCDLARMSLLRAHEYSQAVFEKQYISGTRIQNCDAFHTNLRSFLNLAERKIFQFHILQIESKGRSVLEMNELLQGCVRANDIIGVMPNGNIRILLSQAGTEDLQYVLPRFESRGLDYRILDAAAAAAEQERWLQASAENAQP